jgi:hypothetical protein
LVHSYGYEPANELKSVLKHPNFRFGPYRPTDCSSRQKNKKARLHTEDEPIALFSWKTFFSNPAIRVILSMEDRGPVALRPRISPGLPFSKSNNVLKHNRFKSNRKNVKNVKYIGALCDQTRVTTGDDHFDFGIELTYIGKGFGGINNQVHKDLAMLGGIDWAA